METEKNLKEVQERPYTMIANSSRFQPQHIPSKNVQENIIAGPNLQQWHSGDINFNHSPGLAQPMVRSEGPLPIQGNIGQLMKEEVQRYVNCSGPGTIGGARNCTPAFHSDTYTLRDTCGANCVLKAPEAIGMKDFGFANETSTGGCGIQGRIGMVQQFGVPEENGPQNYPKITNAHGLHAFKNVRAGSAGQSSLSGCYEDLPNLEPTRDGSDVCRAIYRPKITQVGNWTLLPPNQPILQTKFP